MKKIFVLLFITLINSKSFAFTNPGMGFLFPDTEPLGKGNSRFNFVEIVFIINYAYGLMDSGELKLHSMEVTQEFMMEMMDLVLHYLHRLDMERVSLSFLRLHFFLILK